MLEMVLLLMVAGAGNSGANDYAWPASYSSVISVAAVHSNGVGAGFSQSNDQVERSSGSRSDNQVYGSL